MQEFITNQAVMTVGIYINSLSPLRNCTVLEKIRYFCHLSVLCCYVFLNVHAEIGLNIVNSIFLYYPMMIAEF